jgi:hypothetical protein
VGRYYCSYWELALVNARGCDAVFRLHQRRRIDSHRGPRLGWSDHVVTWAKQARPDWIAPREYAGRPTELTVREARIYVRRRGYRTRVLVLVTTLMDAGAF